jgi:hypothetical protein
MPYTSLNRRGENLKKVFSRRYHDAIGTKSPIVTKSRHYIPILRRKDRARLKKLCAIGSILLSLTLAVMLYRLKHS